MLSPVGFEPRPSVSKSTVLPLAHAGGLIIYVRKLVGNQTAQDSDSFLTINDVSINWNNNAGLLSSYTQNQLYCMSVENGSNQTWEEFSGKANFADASTGCGRSVATCGSVLNICLGKDIQIPEDYLASGVLGSYNCQITLNVSNNSGADFEGEICVITMNSGVIVTSSGQTQVYTGLLTRQDVIDCSQTQAVFHDDVHRMVGGSFWDSAKSVLAKIAPHAKKYLLGHDNK